MKAVEAKDNKSDNVVFLFFFFPFQFCVILNFWIMKDNGGISIPYLEDDSVEKDNIDLQRTSSQFFKQTISHICMNFATGDHDTDASTVEVEKQHVTRENVAKGLYDT